MYARYPVFNHGLAVRVTFDLVDGERDSKCFNTHISLNQLRDCRVPRRLKLGTQSIVAVHHSCNVRERIHLHAKLIDILLTIPKSDNDVKSVRLRGGLPPSRGEVPPMPPRELILREHVERVIQTIRTR